MSKIRLFGTSSGYVEIAPAAAAGNNTLTAPSTVGEIIAKDAAGAIGVTSVHTTNVVATGTTKVGAAVTISESGIEASGIGITCANINGAQIGGRRNLIINGAMEVAQRGTSSTSDGYHTVDRFQMNYGGENETPTQSTFGVNAPSSPYHLPTTGDHPYKEGLRTAFGVTNGNQTGGAGVNDYMRLVYAIEDQDLATSGWNYTSSSSDITLSFWVKSSVAQNFYFGLQSDNGSQYRYIMETGSLVAFTWKKIVRTIPGNSNIVLNNDNGVGMYITWHLFDGTDRTGSRPLNAWAALDNTSRTPDQTSTWYTTNDASFQITGVQLEVGSQATLFEHRRYQEELHHCKRYYQRYPESPTADNYNCVPSATMACNNTTTAYYCPTLNPTMRSSPSFSHSGNFRMNGTSGVNNIGVTAIGVYHNGAATPFQYATVASGLTAGQAVVLSVNNDATAYIAYNAEL